MEILTDILLRAGRSAIEFALFVDACIGIAAHPVGHVLLSCVPVPFARGSGVAAARR